MIEALRSVCRDVCGPAGTSAVVRSESGSGVTLTACGSRLLGAFAEHPVPGVVVQNTCAAQQAIYGEGGLTSTILACTLIRLTSELGARRRTDHLLLADTFQRCLGWCYECLESTSGGTPIFFRVPFRRGGDDEEAFAALARTVLFPKLLAVSDARAMDAIADALVRSFVADGDADEATKLDREGFVDGLRVLEVVGAPRECSRRAPGVFIARAPVMDFDFALLAGNEAGTRAAGGRVLIVAESMRLPSCPERTRRAAADARSSRATTRAVHAAPAAMVSDAALSVETRARKRKRDLAAQVGVAFPGLPFDVAVSLVEKHLPDPADLAALRAVSKGVRSAVDATGRNVAESGEYFAAERGYLSTPKCLRRRGVLKNERLLCASAARIGVRCWSNVRFASIVMSETEERRESYVVRRKISVNEALIN